MTLQRPPLFEDVPTARQELLNEAFNEDVRRGLPFRRLRRKFRSLGLRARMSWLTALLVAIAIIVITLSSYSSVRQVLYTEMDRALQSQAQAIAANPPKAAIPEPKPGEDYKPKFEDTANFMQILIVPPSRTGDNLEREKFTDLVSPSQLRVLEGKETYAFNEEGEERSTAVRSDDGYVVVLRQSMTFIEQTLNFLGLVLMLVSVTGAFGAIITGIGVASAGTHPIGRLRRAADHVTQTGELKQIPIFSKDELGSLTASFNEMMKALQDSHDKQKELVADASHELKTPLTSLRTNIELILLAWDNSLNPKPGVAQISKSDREEIKQDVLGQLDEMSALVGDLVALAREDAPEMDLETVELDEIIAVGIERVRRRRPDIEFSTDLLPWRLEGDPFGLSRALLNIMDNAAKWSPEGGTVRVFMEPILDSSVEGIRTAIEIRIADSGPGIPLEDRAKVFDRFYRSIASRSMPGSGLGLAIAMQVVERHGGSIIVDDSDDGGALIRVILPGCTEDDLILLSQVRRNRRPRITMLNKDGDVVDFNPDSPYAIKGSEWRFEEQLRMWEEEARRTGNTLDDFIKDPLARFDRLAKNVAAARGMLDDMDREEQEKKAAKERAEAAEAAGAADAAEAGEPAGAAERGNAKPEDAERPAEAEDSAEAAKARGSEAPRGESAEATEAGEKATPKRRGWGRWRRR